MPALDRLTYTQMPNNLIDLYMSSMDGSELKVVLYVIRQTLGWNRDCHRLTNGVIAKATGLSERQVSRAVAKALDDEFIARKQLEDGSYVYFPNFQQEEVTLCPVGDGQNVEGGIDKMSTIKRNKNLNKKNIAAQSDTNNPQENALDASQPSLDLDTHPSSTAMVQSCENAQENNNTQPEPRKRRSNLSEAERTLMAAYTEASGVQPAGTDWGRWRKIFKQWIERGITPDIVRAAVNVNRRNHYGYGWPGAIDKTVLNLAAEKRSGNSSSARNSTFVKQQAPLIIGKDGSFNF